MKSPIGIIGSGNIGGTLGQHFSAAGHPVMFSSRTPEALQDMATAAGARVGTPQEALDFGDIILLATPYGANPGLAAGLSGWEGKLVIDTTNPYPERDGVVAEMVIASPYHTSSGYVQELFPRSKVVKAFNAIHYTFLRDHAFREGEERLAVPVAGDNPEALATVIRLLESLGYWALSFGPLKESVMFEPQGPFYNQNLPKPQAEKLFGDLMMGDVPTD